MTGEQDVLPIADILTEIQNRGSLHLERPQLTNTEHLAALHRLNEETAATGQVSIDSEKPDVDSAATEHAWASGEFGYFRFVMKKSAIAGAVWSLPDSHTNEANKALQKAGVSVVLSADHTCHREASSYIFEEVDTANEADRDATMLQLAEEFGLWGETAHPVDTMAVYMDDVDDTDRDMMNTIGFTVSADGVAYAGSGPCTVFVATAKSVAQAIRNQADSIGITATSHDRAALR
jgi:hypothetical protein